MNNDVMFSSEVQTWSTPQWLYNRLNSEFSFTLDACADKSNHKCKKYFTEVDDGLSQSWTGETVWINPPYNRAQVKWIEKAYHESRAENTTCVMLLPARPDTAIWFNVIAPYATEIRFLKGRLKFSGHANSAPFPSCIVVFGTFPYMNLQVSWVDYKE